MHWTSTMPEPFTLADGRRVGALGDRLRITRRSLLAACFGDPALTSADSGPEPEPVAALRRAVSSLRRGTITQSLRLHLRMRLPTPVELEQPQLVRAIE